MKIKIIFILVVFILLSLFFLFLKKEKKHISNIESYNFEMKQKKFLIKNQFMYNHQN